MNRWGNLAPRFENKDRPRTILACDGGGIRGVVSLEILETIETQLRAQLKTDDERERFRLCHFFDYIGGTSTGAIIAAGLAVGKTIAELKHLYFDECHSMFDKAFLLCRLRHFYTADPLVKKLKAEFGEHTNLLPEHLRCLLLVVTRNVTTDSPWPISSNPLAQYNDASRPDCNLKIPLWQLVRASTAAPIYFPPEVVDLPPENPVNTFVFMDGGVTPYNSPAFLMYRMATMAEYRLGWPTGERNLMIVSVGTGSAAREDSNVFDPERLLPYHLLTLPGVLMHGIQNDADINCRMIGRCVSGAPIDREIGDLIPRRNGTPIPLAEDQGRAFLYARFDPDIGARGLRALGLADIDPDTVGKMDCVDAVADLSRIGAAAARNVAIAEQFAPFVERFRERGIG
jgi:hypothetical protein